MDLSNFSMTSLMLALLFSSVGMGLFVYGKRTGRLIHLLAGVGLMVYPIFVSNAWAMGIIGAVLTAAPFVWPA